MSKRIVQETAADLSVMAYLDYRDYLGELYSRVKATTTPYSYLHFAEDLGFSPTNVVRLVVARKRTLAMKSARTICDTVGLKRDQRRYFLAMVQYVNARTAEARARFFKEMLETKLENVAATDDKDRMEYYADWLHPVVRELVRLGGARQDPAWLAQQLYAGVSADKVRESLDLLGRLGLLPRAGEAAGASPMLLPTDATAGVLSVTRYHQAMIDLARQAMDRVPPELREFDALTVALSARTFQRLKRRLTEFCAEILAAEAEEQAREMVAQVNLQLFSLTKPLTPPEGEG